MFCNERENFCGKKKKRAKHSFKTSKWGINIEFLYLDFVKRGQMANSIILTGVEEKDGDKTTEVALEILKKVDPEI